MDDLKVTVYLLLVLLLPFLTVWTYGASARDPKIIVYEECSYVRFSDPLNITYIHSPTCDNLKHTTDE